MKNRTALYDKIFKTAMATTIAASAIVIAAPEATKANVKGVSFDDVKENTDYYQYVQELFERGFINGYSDGSFKPLGQLTRAQAAKILALNLGLDVTKRLNTTFTDVPQNDWAVPYIVALKEAGIIDGYQDGTFKPNAPISREQMAKMIVKGYGLEPGSTISLPFTDVSQNNWAAPYIQTLFDLGIIKGQSATTYGGKSTVTRANMAAFTIRGEAETQYHENRRPDEDEITSIVDNKITIGNQVFYIKEELQPLLHARNLAALNEANLDFIKIGTKIVGIRNLELLHSGTAENPLTLDLAGSTVEANITIASDYIKLANANIVGDITIKKGDQKQIELNGLDLNGRLIVEGEANRDQETVIKQTNVTVSNVVVNRDETKIVTDNATPIITVGNNVSKIEIDGKISTIDFVGNQNVRVNGNLDTNGLMIKTPIKVTLTNKANLPQVETQEYGSQLIVPQESIIGKLIKPDNVETQEAVINPFGGLLTIGDVVDTADVVRPTPNSTGGSGNSGGGYTNPFVTQTLTTHNVVDAGNADSLAVGMIGTTVTTTNANVATATIEGEEIKITSKGVGTATIVVKEDPPSLKETQITVTVAANGQMSLTIKRPLEVALEKINATPTPAITDLVKLYAAAGMQGITEQNAAAVTEAVKTEIANKGALLTAQELRLTIDVALLPEHIKKDNPSIQQVSTSLDLIVTGPNETSFAWKAVTPVDGAAVDHTTGNVTRSANDNTNDIVQLGVTATNGAVTKETTLDATILESQTPHLISAILNDVDGNGDTSSGDSILFNFSEPVIYTGGDPIDQNLFGKAFAFGEGTIGNPITSNWSGNKTQLTMTVGGDITSPNVFKIDSDITLVPSAVTDDNGNTNIESITNLVKLQHVPLDYEISTNNLSGDYHYNGSVIESEAVAQIKNDITFTRNGVPLTNATITYDSDDIASGSIASDNFTLKSIQVTENGKTSRVVFKPGDTIQVNTSDVLKVVDATQLAGGINSTHVQSGKVKTVAVDSVDSIVAPGTTLTFNYPVTLDGKAKLEVGTILINADITLQNVDVIGFHGMYPRTAISIGGSANKVVLNHVNVNRVLETGYNYAALSIEKDNVELNIFNSDIEAKYNFSGIGTDVYAYGIYAPNTNIKITSENSTIAGLNVNATYLRGAYGIYVGENATLDIKASTIQASGGGSYTTPIQGIHIENGSTLTISDNSIIEVTAKDVRDAYGIYKMGTVDATYTGTIFTLIADPGYQAFETN